MDLIIPTCGRAREQSTLAQLLPTGLPVTLVVQVGEFQSYSKYLSKQVDVICLPESINTIAPTRQWILDNARQDNICMLDDDLVFYRRRLDDTAKLRDISSHELFDAFKEMDWYLSNGFPHVGFAAREGANRNTEEHVDNTRIMRVLGYNVPTLRKHGLRFNTMEVMEDFHIALCLLEHGYPNRVLNDYAHNQAGSGKSGGCSHFRTPALHAENARKLAELHLDVVKVVQKTTKTAWGGGTRTDVVIQWKKAYEQATCIS